MPEKNSKSLARKYLFEKLLNKTWTMRKIVNFMVLLDGCCLPVSVCWRAAYSLVCRALFSYFAFYVCRCLPYAFIRLLSVSRCYITKLYFTVCVCACVVFFSYYYTVFLLVNVFISWRSQSCSLFFCIYFAFTLIVADSFFFCTSCAIIP